MSFVAIPGLIGPMLGPLAGGLIVAYFHWRVIFFVNLPIGLLGLYLVYLTCPTTARRRRPARPRRADPVRFRRRPALLRPGSLRRARARAPRDPRPARRFRSLLLFGYWLPRRRAAHPLLACGLFRIRTFRVAVGGGFITRLGVGGVPFLLPLLYQMGLGYTPVAVGTAHHAPGPCCHAMKFMHARLLNRFGYRDVLISNTVVIGIISCSSPVSGSARPSGMIVRSAFCYGPSLPCSTRA